LHDSLPLLGKIVRPKHPRGFIAGANDVVTGAGELFEVGGGVIEGNGALLTQVVTQNKISLVVGEDEIGRIHVLPYKLHRGVHVGAALIGAVHPWRARFAKGEAGHNDQSCDRDSAPPSVRRQTRYCQTGCGHGWDDQECYMPCAAVGVNMRQAGAAGNRKRQEQKYS